jgi:hypothetical protein
LADIGAKLYLVRPLDRVERPRKAISHYMRVGDHSLSIGKESSSLEDQPLVVSTEALSTIRGARLSFSA